MAERAYNLSNASVRKLSYSGVVSQSMTGNMTLDETSPQVLFLNPGDSVYRLELLQAIHATGCIYWIENTTLGSGTIQIWNSGQTTMLGTLLPGYRGVLISTGSEWKISISTQTGSAISGFNTLVTSGSWTVDNTGRPAGSTWRYADINHGIGKQYVLVQCARSDKMIIPAEIEYTDANNIRIWIATGAAFDMQVIISG